MNPYFKCSIHGKTRGYPLECDFYVCERCFQAENKSYTKIEFTQDDEDEQYKVGDELTFDHETIREWFFEKHPELRNRKFKIARIVGLRGGMYYSTCEFWLEEIVK